MMETKLVRKDGTEFPAIISFAPVNPNEPDGPQAFAVLDVEVRKRRENELRRMTELLNATQRLTRVGGWEWDTENQSMFWTEETYRIHGIKPEDVVEGSPEHIQKSLSCYPEEAVPVITEAFRRCAEEGEPYDLEFAFTSVDGRSTRIRTTAEAIRKEGKVVKVIGNIMDIGSGTKSDGQADGED